VALASKKKARRDEPTGPLREEENLNPLPMPTVRTAAAVRAAATV